MDREKLVSDLLKIAKELSGSQLKAKKITALNKSDIRAIDTEIGRTGVAFAKLDEKYRKIYKKLDEGECKVVDKILNYIADAMEELDKADELWENLVRK